MATALDQYASMSIAFKVPGDATTPNGRGVEASTATEIVAVCYVNIGSSRQRPEGSNTFTEIPLTGFFLAPQMLPASILPGVVAPAILWRLGPFSLVNPSTRQLRQWSTHAAYDAFVNQNRGSIDHEGAFTLALSLASKFVLPRKALGKDLSGIFSVKSQWSDVI